MSNPTAPAASTLNPPIPTTPPVYSLGTLAMTLDSYNGKSNPKDYFYKAEQRAQLDNWSNDVLLKLIKFRLTGDADKYLRSNPTVNNLDYTNFKSNIIKEFTIPKAPGQTLLKLSKCFQDHNETVQSFITRLKTIGVELYNEDMEAASVIEKPGLEKKNHELILNQFKTGLRKDLQKNLSALFMRTSNLDLSMAENFARQQELSDSLSSRNATGHVMAIYQTQSRNCTFCGLKNHVIDNCWKKENMERKERTNQTNYNQRNYDTNRFGNRGNNPGQGFTNTQNKNFPQNFQQGGSRQNYTNNYNQNSPKRYNDFRSPQNNRNYDNRNFNQNRNSGNYNGPRNPNNPNSYSRNDRVDRYDQADRNFQSGINPNQRQSNQNYDQSHQYLN